MKCINCDNEAMGKSMYCSASCRTVYNRNRKRNNVTAEISVTPAVTKSDVTDTEKTDITLTPEILARLPQGVVRPTGQPNEYTADMKAEPLAWAVSCGANWQSSPEYAEVIHRLLTLSVDELREQGMDIPVWKEHAA